MIAPAEVEVLVTSSLDRRERDRFGAEAVDVDAHRVGDADRVRDLDLAAVGEAGGDDVLRDVAGGVPRRAVDLRRILPREGAAAVRRAPPYVSTTILRPVSPVSPIRAADHELAGRVHVHRKSFWP